MVAPASTAEVASSRTRCKASLRPKGPSLRLNKVLMVLLSKPVILQRLILSNSDAVRVGVSSLSIRACNAVSPKRLTSLPKRDSVLITTSSRIASIGGFVTWANNCLK